jgi:hypothetical protein
VEEQRPREQATLVAEGGVPNVQVLFHSGALCRTGRSSTENRERPGKSAEEMPALDVHEGSCREGVHEGSCREGVHEGSCRRVFMKVPAGRVFMKVPAGRVFMKVPAGRVFMKVPAGRVFMKVPAGRCS